MITITHTNRQARPVTPEDLRAFPNFSTWSMAHLRSLFDDTMQATAHDVLGWPIPPWAKVLVLTYTQVLTTDQLHRWAEQGLPRLIQTYGNACPQTAAWAVQWLAGTDRTADTAWAAAYRALAAGKSSTHAYAAKAAVNAAIHAQNLRSRTAPPRSPQETDAAADALTRWSEYGVAIRWPDEECVQQLAELTAELVGEQP